VEFRRIGDEEELAALGTHWLF